MKLESFTATPYGNGKLQIFFMEPILEDDYEIFLFQKHFKKKKNVKFFYTLKPIVSIEGLICSSRIWSQFLSDVQREEIAKGFYEIMRDVSFSSPEEFMKCLFMLRDAEVKTAEMSRKTSRLIHDKNN